MATKSLFSVPKSTLSERVTIRFEGQSLTTAPGISLAAALLSSGVCNFRSSIVGGKPRAPYCMMGLCFECLVEVDGVPGRQSCLIQVRDGMLVRRQIGAIELKLSSGTQS